MSFPRLDGFGEWVLWNGGEKSPVANGVRVAVRLRSEEVIITPWSEHWNWEPIGNNAADIIAYALEATEDDAWVPPARDGWSGWVECGGQQPDLAEGVEYQWLSSFERHNREFVETMGVFRQGMNWSDIVAYRTKLTKTETFNTDHLATIRKLEAELNEARTQAETWAESAAMHSKSSDYYRDLLVQIGKPFGDDAYRSDDGSMQSDVLVAKVPDLVDDMRLKLASYDLALLRLETRMRIVKRDPGVAKLLADYPPGHQLREFFGV